jgi:hypothetical protein
MVTLDVAQKVASLLSNALAFVNALTSQPKEELAEHDVGSLNCIKAVLNRIRKDRPESFVVTRHTSLYVA